MALRLGNYRESTNNTPQSSWARKGRAALAAIGLGAMSLGVMGCGQAPQKVDEPTKNGNAEPGNNDGGQNCVPRPKHIPFSNPVGNNNNGVASTNPKYCEDGEGGVNEVSKEAPAPTEKVADGGGKEEPVAGPDTTEPTPEKVIPAPSGNIEIPVGMLAGGFEEEIKLVDVQNADSWRADIRLISSQGGKEIGSFPSSVGKIGTNPILITGSEGNEVEVIITLVGKGGEHTIIGKAKYE